MTDRARIRIACVRYLNTLPLVHGLGRCAEVEVSATVPSRIAELVRTGAADLGLASLVDAARGEADLAVLDAGMIGCDGPTLTVRLFSMVPIERVRTLHADGESHTSTAVALVVLERMRGVRPRVVEFDASAARAAGDRPETVLLIGDKVVCDEGLTAGYPVRLDLGEAWRELTGLPLVYAAWMCRAADLEDPARRARLESAAAILDRQRRRNAMRLGAVVAARGSEHAGWPGELAARYVGGMLRYELDDRAREGAEAFVREAHRLGLTDRSTLRWATLREPAAV